MFQFEVGDGTTPWVTSTCGKEFLNYEEIRIGMVANTYKEGYYGTTVTLPK